MGLSPTMIKALHLTGGDAPPAQIAAHALAVAGYTRPDPRTVLTDRDSTAIRFLCALVEGVDHLAPRARPPDHHAVADEIVDATSTQDAAAVLKALDAYLRQNGAPPRPRLEPTMKERIEAGNRERLLDLASRVVAAVAISVEQ